MAGGAPDARASTYMDTAPITSTSQAEGISFSPMIDMVRQVAQPKLFWSSLQNNFGCATCLTMSIMGEKLMPSACEVDVMGAVSMYVLALASGAPPAILDWNNNYGSEPDMCVCTHC